MSFDLSTVGGVRSFLMGGPELGAETWNFGVTPETAEVSNIVQSKPPLYAAYPEVAGRWSGQSVSHFAAAVAVLGEKVGQLVQQQPRGTCGGRAGSAAIDFVQCVMMAAGRRATFRRASHAWLYFNARKKYGMAKGNWQDDRQDGVPHGSIPEILTTIGVTTREESGDNLFYGSGSDELAVKWGAGMIDSATEAKLRQLSSDNVVKDWAPVRSAQELADGIAAGGVGIGSDSQGFTMTRDAQGFCRARGVWHHYHVRTGVVNVQGRKGFEYWQSWGTSGAPGGPIIDGRPGNVFYVDWDVQDRLCAEGRYAVVFGVPLWDLKANPIDLTWIF